MNFIFTKQLRYSGLPAVVLVGKLKKDISFPLRLSCLRTAMTYGSPPRRIRVGRIREGSR